MNSTVHFAINVTDVDFMMILVFPADMLGNAETISILVPAGSVMLGLREGAGISWSGADGNTLKLKNR